MRWWEIVGSFGPLVGALATAFLAWLAWKQLQSLNDQVKQGQGELEAAKMSAQAARDSADAAQDALRESTRSRLDETAPRIVLLFEAPQWPPLIDSTRPVVQGGEPALLDVPQQSYLASEQEGEFVFPQDHGKLLWFRVRAVVINEGNGTARIRLPPGARFVQGETPLLSDQYIEVPLGPDRGGLHVLRPREAGLFEWGVGNSMRDWADAWDNPRPPNPRGSLFGDLAALSFDGSIAENIPFELRASPIERVPNRGSSWRLATRGSSPTVVVGKTDRRYPGDGPPAANPWADRYAEWQRQSSG